MNDENKNFHTSIISDFIEKYENTHTRFDSFHFMKLLKSKIPAFSVLTASTDYHHSTNDVHPYNRFIIVLTLII
jgi:hypothetical protein